VREEILLKSLKLFLWIPISFTRESMILYLGFSEQISLCLRLHVLVMF